MVGLDQSLQEIVAHGLIIWTDDAKAENRTEPNVSSRKKSCHNFVDN